MSARPVHRPRHSRPRDGLARAVLLDEPGWLIRAARIVSRCVALLLALCLGALLISLIAGTPVAGISNPLHWHDRQAGPATHPRAEVSTPVALTSATGRSASAAGTSGSSTTVAPQPLAAAPAPRSSRTPASPSSTALGSSATPTRPGIGRTHANSAHANRSPKHPRPTKTHHP